MANTNINWLDKLMGKHPILLKGFLLEIERLRLKSQNKILDKKKVLALLQKEVAKLEKEVTSFRRKEIIAKAYKESVPKHGQEGYQAIPLWKLELESILDHLTFNSVEYEKVSASIAIHRLNRKIIKLIERKVKRHAILINDNLSKNLANNGLVCPQVSVKKPNVTAVVALNQEVEGVTKYIDIISSGIKQPLYAVFSVSLLCMIFFGGSIFTAASSFFTVHSSYLFICLFIISLSVHAAFMQSKYRQIENIQKIQHKSLVTLEKKTLSMLVNFMQEQVPKESQILDYNNELTGILIQEIKTHIEEEQVSLA